INEVYKSKDGNTTTTKESTDFIPIVLFNKKAETASTYLKKGDKFLGTGKLRTSSYIDEGGNIKYTWQVIINHFEFVSGKKEEQSTQNKELPKEMDKSLPNKESYAE
ncbi:single-stranded DNA-binding protein, partial [Campylobacter helveticus]